MVHQISKMDKYLLEVPPRVLQNFHLFLPISLHQMILLAGCHIFFDESDDYKLLTVR